MQQAEQEPTTVVEGSTAGSKGKESQLMDNLYRENYFLL